MKTYEWKTAKGANVKIEVSQSHREKTEEGLEITKIGMQLEQFELNGTEYYGRIRYRGDAHHIMFAINSQQAGVEIPKDIYKDMMEETREREQKARAEMDKYYTEQATIERFDRGTY